MTLHVHWCKAHRKSRDATTLIFCPMCLVEEMEGTAKPAPIPTVTVCPACLAQAREGEGLVHAQGCRVPYFGAFPDLPAPTRTCSHVDETAPVPEARCPECGCTMKPDLMRTDNSTYCPACSGMRYLTGENATLVVHLNAARAEVDRLKAEKAQAEVKERERIIQIAQDLYTESAGHPSYGRLFASQIRAALEPKEGPCS